MRRWLPWVAGIGVLVIVVGIAAIVVSVSWFQEHLQVTRGTRPEDAAARFDEAQRQFPDARPILRFGDDRTPRYAEGIEGRKNPGTVTSVHVLAFDPDERALAELTLPMWLLRLKSGPIVFGEYVSGLDDYGVRLTAQDLERYGPGVVFDLQRPGGERVLLTAR